MNDLMKLLNIDVPFLQGGMGNVSHPDLAVSVSEAGGLGTLGAGTLSPSVFEKMVKEVRSQTHKPFSINVPLSVHPDVQKILSIAAKHHVPVVSLSAGNPSPYIEMLKKENIIVMCVVSNPSQALKAEKAGADVIIAEGFEAAGINANDELTTFTLIPQVASVVKAPVVAAGGIGDGRGLLAALSLGAQGVQLGTRLIATEDANVHSNYKQAICKSDASGTVITGRPYKKIRRLLKTTYANQLLEWEKNKISAEEYDQKTDESCHIKGAIEGKLTEGHVNAGQVSSLIEDLPTVSELFQRMMNEARTVSNHLSF
ncbi:NAD(P)H-dependent flavin oxidoreductase [Alteribacillus bidgolensis]|uniref:Probable nitronate monooxygenase n=1 Tax=Alteribacillus bidgolensis TaxID=930129 RepID=A0A1G8IAX5_9BACI|nr:nitronate monooxygenase family protein [Alteribacillus bidgolensis]SDI15911.1 enoyl-[acyl-carrier protein] reductase II [Alteribacillus bidgolensis]